MDQPEFLAALSEFLSEKRGKPTVVDSGSDLLALGFVDSLIMVEILMLIEQLSGRPIDADALEPEIFESADRLYRTFFSAAAPVSGVGV